MIQAGVPPDDADEDAAGETEVSENEEEKVGIALNISNFCLMSTARAAPRW